MASPCILYRSSYRSAGRTGNAGGVTYRFAEPGAFGFQRLYAATTDRTLTVTHGDVDLIRSGEHPFVTAHGYNAYYLNVLAGTRRSMAAGEDPRYAALRNWPARGPRVPVVVPPAALASGS